MKAILPLSRALCAVEAEGEREAALAAAHARLGAKIARLGYPCYDRFVLGLGA